MKLQVILAVWVCAAMLAVAGQTSAQSSIGGGQGLQAPVTISGSTGCNTSGTLMLKGNGSGGCANAAAGTDYAPATSGSAILKGNGSGGFSNAASGTDYAPATSGSLMLKGNGTGGFSSAAAGADYQAPIANLQFGQAAWAMNAMTNSGGL